MPIVQFQLPDFVATKISAEKASADAIKLLAAAYEISGLITPAQVQAWLSSASSPGQLMTATPPNIVQNFTKPVVASNSAPNGAQNFTIYTDGACQGNPGVGGWGTIIHDHQTNQKIEKSGGKSRATNNQMEMTAVIEGLRHTPTGSRIKIVADSEYVIKGITEWLPNWIRSGWQTASKTPVKNKELWEEIHSLTQQRKVEWTWVRGHAGHPENERCDQLAVEAAVKQ